MKVFNIILLFSSISFNLLSQNLNSGLRAHYSFDNTLNDISGNSHHLLNDLGSVSYNLVSGSDYSVSLDGVTRLKQVDAFNNSVDTAGAISMWFKTNATSSINQMLIQGSYIGFGLFITPVGFVSGFYGGSSTYAYSHPVNMLDNEWHHVVCQSNGSTIFLYIDGEACGSIAHSFYNGTGALNNKIYFGTTNLNSANYTGELNNCRIYDRLLSVCEIKELALLPEQISHATITETACNSYVWNVNAQEYFTSGFFSDTLQSVNGCDSILNLDLTISTTLGLNILSSNDTMYVNAPDSFVSWMDCESQIVIATNSNTFSPSNLGWYAAIINNNGCIDTTVCQTVKGLNQVELGAHNSVSVYPNPTRDKFYFSIPGFYNVKIINSLGNIIYSKSKYFTKQTPIYIHQDGFYVIEISDDNITKKIKLIKH